MLGIEAARAVLVKELSKVLEYDGTYVNPRHVMLLADSMTQCGQLQPMNRYGLKNKTSVLSQASFETATTALAKAAMDGAVDPLLGVTECIITGQMPPVGTACDTELWLDEEKLKHYTDYKVKEIQFEFGVGIIGSVIEHDTEELSVLGSPLSSPTLGEWSPSPSSPLWSPPQSSVPSPRYSPSTTSQQGTWESPQYVPSSPSYSPSTPTVESKVASLF